jgi:hypothetical protein
MPNDRRDDWAHGVDELLVTLTTAQKVTDQQLDELESTLDALDKILRGDPEKDTDGLIARLHTMENHIAKLDSCVFKDTAGNKGIQGRLEDIEREERNAGYRWKFWTAIVGMILATITAVLTNLDKLEVLVKRREPVPQEKPVRPRRHRPPSSWVE